MNEIKINIHKYYDDELDNKYNTLYNNLEKININTINNKF